MSYLARFPIHVRSKKAFTKQPYRKDKYFKTGYAELNIRKNGAIEFNLRIGDQKYDFKITISKWSLYQMFLYHLSLRPIWQTKSEFYISPEMRKVKYVDIDKVPIADIIDDYDGAVKHLRLIIPTMDGEHKDHAETQMRNLLDRQWKIDILRQIRLSMDIETNGLPEK